MAIGMRVGIISAALASVYAVLRGVEDSFNYNACY
jgi:hypothetical protein